MKKFKVTKPLLIILIIFFICNAFKDFEYLVIKTDHTFLDDNTLNKLFGIVVIFIALKLFCYTWHDIGFKKEKLLKGFLAGTLLGVITFAIAYAVEIIVLHMNGSTVFIQFYAAGFSLTGTTVKNTAASFIILTIIVNLLNSWMEEGLFRGLFVKIASTKYCFAISIVVQSLLFGVWHIIIPIQSVIEGQMTVSVAVLMSIGYIILAFIMGVKWGLCTAYSGAIWVAFSNHMFNDLIENLIHVVTPSGADKLQIILAQFLSLAIVIVYGKLKMRKSLKIATLVDITK